MKLVIPLFQSEFDALQLLVTRFGKIPPIGGFGYFWWLLWLKNPIFRHDFEIGHLVGVLAYYPIAKNRKSRFGQGHAQNRAHISSVFGIKTEIVPILVCEKSSVFGFYL